METKHPVRAGLAVLALTAIGGLALGDYWSSDKTECNQPSMNFLEVARCGLFGTASDEAEAASNTTTTLAAPVETVVVPDTIAVSPPVEPSPALAPTIDDDPFDITYWPAPDGTQLMIIDGKYPVNFQHDDKWNYPKGLIPTNPEDSSGCMCGENVYVTGDEFLSGEYSRADDMYLTVEDLNGHESDSCGAVLSDRKLVGEYLGYNYHHFNSLAEAEAFVTTVDSNAFVIIAQYKTPVGGEGFSPYGKHIIGLVWDTKYGAWRALDPNDAHKDEEMLLKEHEMQDIPRFWRTDQITDLYDVAAWTNPAGRQPGPWEVAA